jgi:hypothetical protein
MEAAAIAAALGLGDLRGPVEILKHDEPYPVWKLDTDAGAWVVKASVPWGDYWHGMAAQSGALEAAAWRAGVDMAEPLLPEGADPGLWLRVSDDTYASASRFLDGANPPAPVPPGIAAWAGGTVAALARLEVPADPAYDSAFNTHPQAEWDEWLGQATDLGVLDTAQARALKDAAVRIGEIAATGRAAALERFVFHNDFSHRNIIVTPEGPRLIDFDGAGVNAPWWELVAVAVEMGAPGLGVMDPDRASVEACVDGYQSAGGALGDTDESAFTGILTGRLASTAWELWMACGHRGGSAEQQAEFGRIVRASVTALSTMLDAVPTWVTWLKG